MVKVCDICGDIGDSSAIITCCECTSSRQHLYCMRVVMDEAPAFWTCDECEQSKLLSPTKTLRDHKRESCSAPKRSNFTPNKKSPASRHRFKEARVDTGKTQYITCDEAVKLSSGSNNPSRTARMRPPQPRTPIKSVLHDRSQKSTSPREKVVQYFQHKGTATSSIKPPARETKSVESPTPKRSTEFEPHVVQRSTVAKETVISPLQNRGDTTSSLKSPKKTDVQKSAVKQSAGQKVNIAMGSKNGGDDAVLPGNRSAPCTGGKRKFIEAKSVVVYSRKEADRGKHVKSPKSTEQVKETAKAVVASPRNEELDVGKQNDMPESSEKLEKTNTKPGAGVETGSCDVWEPHLMVALPFSEEDNPYIPSYLSYWRGSFILPNGHEKLNDAFKAHLPSRVDYNVYETVKNMKEMHKELVFTLLPTQDIWMQVFPGYVPDTNDIGLYFFPTFKKRLENDLSITDFLWREKLMMKSNVVSFDLLVFSSRVLQQNSQEFRGNHFLWGVLRRPKHENLAKTPPLLLEKECEKCDAAPPGFVKICKCC